MTQTCRALWNPGMSQYQAPTIRTVQKMVEVRQSHCFDRVVDELW